MKINKFIKCAAGSLTALTAACLLLGAARRTGASAYAVFDFPADIPVTDENSTGSDHAAVYPGMRAFNF